MRGVLGLAADFIDRMTNPAHGQEENAAYAARFAELLERDEELQSQLLASDLGPDDVDLLGLQGVAVVPQLARHPRHAAR